MARTKQDPLAAPLERFEQALADDAAGRERDWAEGVCRALATLEGALWQHTVEADASNGLFAEVDLTRPTLARQVGVLRQEHSDFLQQASALQLQLQRAASAFQLRREAPAMTNPLPEPEPPGTIPDFGVLRQRGEQFATALRRHRETETDLLLETVTTDIGVGD
jgi:hypothetical protein